jgi:hypothetical protein
VRSAILRVLEGHDRIERSAPHRGSMAGNYPTKLELFIKGLTEEVTRRFRQNRSVPNYWPILHPRVAYSFLYVPYNVVGGGQQIFFLFCVSAFAFVERITIGVNPQEVQPAKRKI